jgi:hypothetical protein
MGLTERVWGALTAMVRLEGGVTRQAEALRAQQARIEDMTGRLIRLEARLELLTGAALVERRRRIAMKTIEHATTAVAPFAARFATLALRRGLALGTLRSGRSTDFAVVLAAAAQGFHPDRAYTEREVNELLRAFLAGPGAMLATDHVELRRWLVDYRLLARDGFGRAYTVGTPSAEIVAAAAQLATVDLAAVAREAREHDAAVRAQRKARRAAAG